MLNSVKPHITVKILCGTKDTDIDLMIYEIIIYWSEEDGAYIAEAPELAGCASDGKTYLEALRNIETVIEEWIETAKLLGRQIPDTKGRLNFA